MSMRGMYYESNITGFMGSGPVIFDAPHYESIKYFLQVIERLVPKAVADLDKIRALYTSSVRDDLLYPPLLLNYSDLWYRLHQSEVEASLLFSDEILKWGRSYNLVDPQFKQPLYLNIAISAITGCIKYNGFLECQDITQETISLPDSITRGYDTFSGIPFVFAPTRLSAVGQDLPADALDPSTPDAWVAPEHWKQFERRQYENFKDYLAAYKAESEENFREKGLKKLQDKDSLYHFEWFVLYQIEGLTSPEIADRYNKLSPTDVPDADTFLHGIREVSKRVLLPKRQ